MKENICYYSCNVCLGSCGCLTIQEQTCQEAQDIVQKIAETLLWVKKCILANLEQLREVLTDPKSHWYLSIWGDYLNPSAGLEYLHQLFCPKYNQDIQGVRRYWSKNSISFYTDVLIFLEHIRSISKQELHDQPEQLQWLIHTTTNRPSLALVMIKRRNCLQSWTFHFFSALRHENRS